MSVSFGENLKKWRKHRGLTLQQVADKVGSSRGYIQELESGKKKYTQDTVQKLAEALETTPGFLIEVDPVNAEPFIQARRIVEAMRSTGTDG